MTPAGDPAGLADGMALPDDRLRVRPLRWCEMEPVRDLYAHLSDRTRYLRFFSPMPVLPDAVLRLLTCVDGRRRLALLAELDAPAGVQTVALGSFAAIDDRRGEIGLVVRDDWQRRGVGRALARMVMRAAEVRGFDRFVAHVLWDNVGIRTFLAGVGGIVSSTMRGGVCELTLKSSRTDTMLARQTQP